jgi:hypothetical protein
MSDAALTRRRLIQTAAAAGITAPLATLNAANIRPTLDFDKPEDNLTALICTCITDSPL